MTDVEKISMAIMEEHRKKMIMQESKTYTVDLGNMERLRGYLTGLWWVVRLLRRYL